MEFKSRSPAAIIVRSTEDRPGYVPYTMSQSDPRFAYCAYVPASADPQSPRALTVVVHGSTRVADQYRDAFVDYADKTGSVVLAPLFPCGILGPGDTESYKFVVRDHVRFDLALLGMVEEARARWGAQIAPGRFCLFGYSGGGQFAHRFAYLQPACLMALSIGAPGKVTLPQEDLPWWRGLGGLDALVDRRPDLTALRQVPIHLVVGDRDLEEGNVVTRIGSPHWMEGINDAGRNRVALIETLYTQYQAVGCDVERTIVPDVAHDGFAVVGAASAFLARHVAAPRGEA